MSLKISMTDCVVENCDTLVDSRAGEMTGYFKCNNCSACMKVISNNFGFPACNACGSGSMQASINDTGKVPDWYIEQADHKELNP